MSKLASFLRNTLGLDYRTGAPLPSATPEGFTLVYVSADDNNRMICHECAELARNGEYVPLHPLAMIVRADTYPDSSFPVGLYRVDTSWGAQCQHCHRWITPEVLACDDCGQKSSDGTVARYPGGFQFCAACRARYEGYYAPTIDTDRQIRLL